jgi:hypothetical protein
VLFSLPQSVYNADQVVEENLGKDEENGKWNRARLPDPLSCCSETSKSLTWWYLRFSPKFTFVHLSKLYNRQRKVRSSICHSITQLTAIILRRRKHIIRNERYKQCWDQGTIWTIFYLGIAETEYLIIGIIYSKSLEMVLFDQWTLRFQHATYAISHLCLLCCFKAHRNSSIMYFKSSEYNLLLMLYLLFK